MKKVQILWLGIGAALIALFNILFFLLGGNQPVVSVWISYAFIHIGYLQVLLVPFVVPKSKSTHSFTESTAAVSAVFFLVSFAIGLLFIILRLDNWVLPLAVQLIILVACIIALFAVHFANTHTASLENSRVENQRALKDAAAALSQAVVFADAKDKPYLQGIIADIKTCPLLASKGLQGIEKNIVAECDEILNAVKENDSNAVHSHGAIVSQLILLRKQNPSD